MTVREISRRLKIRNPEDYQELRALASDLEEQGILVADEQGRFRYVSERKAVRSGRRSSRGLVGRVKVTRRGYGVVHVEDLNEDILIAPKFMKTAMDGDTVAVVPFAHAMKGRRRGEQETLEGEIVEIIERYRTTVVGTLRRVRHFDVVVPDDERLRRDIYIVGDETDKARHGDKVVVQMLPWENEHLNPEGTILEILGPAGDARVEVTGVARSFGLPASFPDAALREASLLDSTVPPEEIARRLDVRDTVSFTIDPDDAKDFDDAITFQQLNNGTVRLGVHIADVSHFVRQGTALDQEALRRGTSVYLVNEVIPMLPERLSTDLCSLLPGVDRLTYSVIMDVNAKGEVEDHTIAESVIHSARRFTYDEVQRVIHNQRGELSEVLLPLHAFTQGLLKRRRRQGSLDFETAEAKFRFDEHGLPSQIVRKQRLDAHRLVEECMLLANATVALHVNRGRKGDHRSPFVYRVHDVPDPSRLYDLANFVKQFGYSLDTHQGVSTRALQRLLEKTEGSDVEYLINEVTLRSMAKAVYSAENIGHYGLGFRYYTHFTSPIRRYPDLIVHRLLKEYAHGVTVQRRREIAGRLPDLCRWCSDRERVAVDAERASVKVMQVEYMKRHLGDEFDGVIGGVKEFGLFVEINDLLVEGLVPVRDLADDYYLYDEKHYRLRGRSRGRSYRLGDRIRVRVVAVRPEENQIEFDVVE